MSGLGTSLVFWLIFYPAMIFVAYGKQDTGRKLANQNPNPDFISIDCGASNNYTDPDGKLYETDTEFIDSGNNYDVDISKDAQGVAPYAMTLRSFPTGIKNCYTLNPKRGKGKRYIIRAIFLYGNYDGKNQVPVFDLFIGVNRWVTVNLTGYSYKEIIHVPSTDYIHVCLVNTGFGTPYISALELRLFDTSSIYQIESGALALVDRYDVGVSKPYTRYFPDDVYDRIWASLDAENFPSWIPINTTSTINSSSNDYKLPYQILNTACRSESSSFDLSLSWNRTRSSARQYYVYLHFAEIEQLMDGQYRDLEIHVNENEFMDITRLEYLTPKTVASKPVNGPIITFSIQSLRDSLLPPILNAFEVYELIDFSNSSTFLKDVEAMMEIKKAYEIKNTNWQGDPCAPIDYKWDNLTCSYNITPRIISLNLSSSNLTGIIATSIKDLKEIESLDLSYNNLNGSLPDFLAELPNLKILNLTGNKLTGSVPESLTKKQSLLLSLEKNPDLCLSGSCKGKSKSFVVIVVASTVSVLFLLILLGALVIFHIIKKRKQGDMISKNQRFSYTELESITDNFKTVIGEGGFGRVFLGALQDGTQVAVKLLSSLSKQGFKEFQAEAQLLAIVHHRNLVSLIGYCDEGQNMGLIYEYMDNGNLHNHLSDSKANVLSWKERLQIAIDAAYGLEYLHNACKPPVIHRDLKTSNILLDKNMRAKIADFGLSRVFATENDSHVSTRPAGTPGYLDPEFHSSGNLNKKSDVYSFGIVLFELITGRPAIIRCPENQSSHILQWVIPIVKRGDIQNIIDPKLEGKYDYNIAWKAVEIALSCIPSIAIQRPDMSYILSELKDCLAMEMATEITETAGSYDTKPIISLETELQIDLGLYPTAR